MTWSESARLLLGGQLAALREFNWSVVSGDPYRDAPSDIVPHCIPMRRELALSDFQSFWNLLRFFRAHRFAFVQTHTPKASLLGLPAARLAGLPTLYTMHGSLYFKDNSLRANIAGWVFERWCAAWAHRVLLQSREDLETVVESRICPRRKVVHVGNGIDLSRFAATGEVPCPPGKPTVLMISRLVAEKGCRDFFEVARALHERASFVHVGPSEKDQRDAITDEEMRHLSTAGYVEFVGPVSDVRPHLARANLVLLPSYREGIPRVAMEAAAASRPVAGYNIRGLREVIPPPLGLLVKRGEVTALIELVGRLLDVPQRLPTLGRACQQWVLSEFSEAAVVERLRGVYRSLLETQ
ncbi:MAG: glycosyltransferase [Actinomycetota bacterium]|nr:glycosyltransferase [Actinomycetota bacterium]